MSKPSAALSGMMGQQGKTIVVAVMVAAMALGGAGALFGGGTANQGGPGGPSGDPAELPDLLPVADDAVTSAFGAELMAQLALPTPTTDLGTLVALDQIGARSLPPEASRELRAGFVEGVTRGRVPNIVEQLHGLVHTGHTLAYRGTAARDGHSVARFRLLANEGGVEFYDFLIGMQNGEPVVIDFCSLSSGQWQSQLLAEGFSLMVGENVTELDALRAIGEAHQAGRYEEVLRLYDALPESAQLYRAATARRIEAAAFIDDTERYLAILDEYTAQFPNDPGAHARLLDVHFQRQQWAEASADVEALNASFPDSYWNSTRASIALGRDEPAEALTFAERVIEEDPSLPRGPDLALVASLALGDHERADRFARILRDDFNVDLHVLASRPRYEGVAELPVFLAEEPAIEDGEVVDPTSPNPLY